MTTMQLVTRDVAEARLHSMMTSGPVEARRILDEVRNTVIEDMVLPIGRHGNGRRPTVAYDEVQNRVALVINERPFGVHAHAAVQLGDKMEVPGRWVRDSMESAKPWRRALVADVLATTVANHDVRDRMLFRAVDGEIRGALSDKYRRLDSAVIADSFSTEIEKLGAVPYRAWKNDLIWGVSALLPRVLEIRMPGGRHDFTVASVNLRSSDFGAGTLELCIEILRLVCRNGAIGVAALKQVHLGRVLPDDIRLSEETYRLDSRTQASAMGDVVRQLLNEEAIARRITAAEEAAFDEVGESGIVGLVKAKRISIGESEAVTKALAAGDEMIVPGGPLTRYRIAQAISHIAKDASDSRGEELERIAGTLILTAASN